MNDIDFSGIVCYNIASSVARASISNVSNHLIFESDPEEGYYARNNFPENRYKETRNRN